MLRKNGVGGDGMRRGLARVLVECLGAIVSADAECRLILTASGTREKHHLKGDLEVILRRMAGLAEQ